MKIIVNDCSCPKCGAQEVHPNDVDKVLVRGFKVCDERGHWWSQCLVCAGYYDPKTLVETPDRFNKAKGWF